MIAKGFRTLIAEANAVVPRIAVDEAQKRLASGDAVFVDVRESQEVAKGMIPGAIHAIPSDRRPMPPQTAQGNERDTRCSV